MRVIYSQEERNGMRFERPSSTDTGVRDVYARALGVE